MLAFFLLMTVSLSPAGAQTLSGAQPLAVAPATSTIVGVQILSPMNGANYVVSDSNYTTTPKVPFIAQIIPTNLSGTINWTVNVSYQTSGGKGASTATGNLQTNNSAEGDETFTNQGGSVTVTAQSTVNGVVATSTVPLSFTISGVSIPNATIISELQGLYSGATPNILVGTAYRESTCAQFVNSTLFGVIARWPTESNDGGSHIGLMQVPVSMAPAWNWTTNAAQGASVFNDDVRVVNQQWTNDKQANPSLPPLSPTQVEDDAICYYEQGPARTNRYWVLSSSGTWVVNTANSVCTSATNGRVAFVRSHLNCN